MWGPGVLLDGLCSRNRAGLTSEVLWRWQRQPDAVWSVGDVAGALGSEVHTINAVITEMTKNGLLETRGKKFGVTQKGLQTEVKRPEGWRCRARADRDAERPVRFSAATLPVVQQLIATGEMVIDKNNLAPLRRLANKTKSRPAYVEIEGVEARVGARVVMPPRVRTMLERRGIVLGKDL